MIRQYRINSGAIDASGDASAFSPLIKGRILSIEVNYPTNTCEVDIDSQEGVSQKILDLAAANTDVVRYPRAFAEKIDGTTLLYTTGEEVPTPFVVHGRLKLTVASGTQGESVIVFVNVEV